MKYRAAVRSVDPLSTTVPAVQDLGTVHEPQQCTNLYVCVFHVKDPFASPFLNISPALPPSLITQSPMNILQPTNITMRFILSTIPGQQHSIRVFMCLGCKLISPSLKFSFNFQKFWPNDSPLGYSIGTFYLTS